MNYRNKILKDINKYCKLNYNKIKDCRLVLGTGLFNRRCHYNSIQSVIEEKSVGVFLCIAIKKDDSDIFVHVINKYNHDHFQDNTLGWRYEQFDYYYIRTIKREEYNDIDKIVKDAKKLIIERCTNKITRFLFNITQDII